MRVVRAARRHDVGDALPPRNPWAAATLCSVNPECTTTRSAPRSASARPGAPGPADVSGPGAAPGATSNRRPGAPEPLLRRTRYRTRRRLAASSGRGSRTALVMPPSPTTAAWVVLDDPHRESEGRHLRPSCRFTGRMRGMELPGEVRVVDDVAASFAELVARAAARIDRAVGRVARARTAMQRCGAAPALDWPSDRRVLRRRALRSGRVTRLERRSSSPRPARSRGARAIHGMYANLGLADAADAYDALIRRSPPIDLIHLGVGPDGHTASLFPHTEALDETTRFVVPNGDATSSAPASRPSRSRRSRVLRWSSSRSPVRRSESPSRGSRRRGPAGRTDPRARSHLARRSRRLRLTSGPSAGRAVAETAEGGVVERVVREHDRAGLQVRSVVGGNARLASRPDDQVVVDVDVLQETRLALGSGLLRAGDAVAVPRERCSATTAWPELARVMPPPHNHGQPEPSPLSFLQSVAG